MNDLVVVNARFLTQNITGVQRFAIELAKQLKILLPNLKFVSPKLIDPTTISKELEIVEIGNLTSHLWEQIELPQYLKSLGYPLLVCLCNTAPVFYKKKIVCIHDLAFKFEPAWFSTYFHTFYNVLIPRVARGSIKVLTVSHFSKKSLQEQYDLPEHRIKVIYNAVSEVFLRTDLEETMHNPTMHNPNKRFILTVSSIDPRKNLRRLIMAFKKAALPNLELIIVGLQSKVFADSDLQALIKGSSNIRFTGYVSDSELRGLYQKALGFIYPSLYEGFGIPPLEAMASGCATAVSRSSSLPEICADAVLYFDPLDEEDIKKAIISLTANQELRTELINKGLQRSKDFSWERSAAELIEVIAEIN